jgi:hypothetical protein
MHVLFLVMGVQNQQCVAQATKSVLMALKKSKQTNSDLLSCKTASATTQAVKRIRERTKPLLQQPW